MAGLYTDVMNRRLRAMPKSAPQMILIHADEHSREKDAASRVSPGEEPTLARSPVIFQPLTEGLPLFVLFSLTFVEAFV